MLRMLGKQEAKELTCMTHGHKLMERIAETNGGTQWNSAELKKME